MPSYRGQYYSRCDWCGAQETNSLIDNVGDGLICKKDLTLLTVKPQSVEFALACFQNLLDNLPYPHKDGYTYQPQRFEKSESGIATVTSLMPWWKGNDGRMQGGGRYPFFDTSEKAVDYIKSCGFEGDVQRYQITPDLIHRTKKFHLGDTSYNIENQPWLTAGVTDVVQAVVDGKANVSIMSMFSDAPPVVHDTATGTKTYLPKRGLTEADWEEIEKLEGDA